MNVPKLRFRALVVSLIFGPALLAAPSGLPARVDAVAPLPECRLDDIMTVPNGYDDWSTTLVDWLLRVPDDYVPPDLVPVGDAGIAGPGLIRKVAIDDLRALTDAAAENGTPIEVNSPYRSYQEQVASFNGWVKVDGYDDAITYSQRPGHSEHQLGLTIDFKALGGPSALPGDWMTTPTGRWMFDNSWKFGWALSYPLGKGGAIFSQATCFHYEPWHYRYLGRKVAKEVHDSGLTIREYLWEHYTRVDPETGEPIPTATPTPSPTPSPTASPTPVATASPSPSAVATASEAAGAAGAPEAGSGLPAVTPLLVVGGIGLLAVLGFLLYAVRRKSFSG